MSAACRPASAEFRRLHRLTLIASASLIALIALCLAWELWLAPLRPGGSWLALKALPLLLPLFGILHGRRTTHQWASLLILLYLLEGLTRLISDAGTSRWLAAGETLLAGIFFAAALAFARLSAPARRKAAITAAD
ncbi:DUF2069 domain-containing protein [Sulfuricystis thermophila]|uniref:DUF2069 domain-containing protein n=1 Tax=Sulfuricystis thermophila TaxID=2496847 RepID=UPI0010368582|nr:DUF2069 domain-containing protein [Sulfuricystis thermophila]